MNKNMLKHQAPAALLTEGTTAYVPAVDAGAVTESGRPLARSGGVTLMRLEREVPHQGTI
jgi:hypothetical protein